MKRIFLITSMIIATVSFAKANDTDNIINALKQGNAGQFSAYFDNFLDLKLPEKDELKNIGKNQAAITIKSFFDANNISGFEVSSQRENEGTMYMTGKLSGSSKSYSLTLLMKSKGDKTSIIKVRIS